MSQLLEILGRGMEVDVCDLVWDWLSDAETTDPPHSEANHSLAQVVNLVKARKSEAARRRIIQYLSDHPCCTRGLLASAALCLDDGSLDDALTQLEHAYLTEPGNILTLYLLGHCCERRGRDTQAAAFYQDCLKVRSYLAYPRQRLAAIYFHNGQLDKTITEYEGLRREYPDSIQTCTTLGWLYITAGNCGRAADAFNAAILMQPETFRTGFDRIDQMVADGEPYQALEFVEEALDARPESPDLLLRKAELLSIIGTDDQALAQYEHALALYPDSLEANICYATHLLRLDRHESAARQLNHAIEVNERIVDAYIGLATAQNLAGQTPDAIVTLSLAAAIEANSPILFADTVLLRMTPSALAHNPPATEDLFNALIGAHAAHLNAEPHRSDLRYRMGLLMMHAARFKDAAELFKDILRLHTAFARARNKLAICLHELDEPAIAAEYLTPPPALEPEEMTLHHRVALLYCDKVRFASSLLNLEQSLRQAHAVSDATTDISVVLQNLGLLDPATARWDGLTILPGA